ncbi:hypothetical protein KKA69_00885 [Patescibacteria group bacterium]|nr:hypothetical protein [Patescibacteria group bacterium]
MAEKETLKKLQKEAEKRKKEYLEFLKKEKEEMRKIQEESKTKAKEFLTWHKAYLEKHFPRKKVKRKK